jgi:hypothetical protein
MNTQEYRSIVVETTGIYTKYALSLTSHHSSERVAAIQAIHEYLLTDTVKPILMDDYFSELRKIILKKIKDHKKDIYLLANQFKHHRFIAALDEMELFLAPNKKLLCRRRSDRLKHAFVNQFNNTIINSAKKRPCTETINNLKSCIARSKELLAANPEPVAEVLPRFSRAKAVAAERLRQKQQNAKEQNAKQQMNVATVKNEHAMQTRQSVRLQNKYAF